MAETNCSSPPVRVLHYVPGFDHGGIEARLLDWFRHVDRSAVSFDVLVASDLNAPLLEEFRRLGGGVYLLPKFRPRSLIAFLGALNQFFRQQAPYDVIHCHSLESSVFVMRAARRYGAKELVLHARTSQFGNVRGAALRNQLRRCSVRAAESHFACSVDAARFMVDGTGVQEVDVRIIPNGFEVDRYRFDADARRADRRTLGVDGSFVIANVGRLSAVKNQVFLLQAFSKVLARVPNARLVLAGEGPMREQLEQQSRALGIAESVILLGYTGDIVSVLRASDVFVMPSLYEGFGTAALEAQASGLPTILSTGLPESVGVTDLAQFLPLDAGPTAWAEAILKARGHSHQDRADEVTKAGYDVREIAGRLAEFYVARSELPTAKRRAHSRRLRSEPRGR